MLRLTYDLLLASPATIYGLRLVTSYDTRQAIAISATTI